jgi:hypothetical protein
MPRARADVGRSHHCDYDGDYDRNYERQAQRFENQALTSQTGLGEFL